MSSKQVSITLCAATLAALMAASVVSAEKVLIYDEERGIIFVDPNNPEGGRESAKQSREAAEEAEREASKPQPTPQRPKNKADIHVGRKKDPPELYFKSGLEYFRNRDFHNALKNFRHASRARPRVPEYRLWVGKTYRQLEEYKKMHDIMNDILKRYPDSDVADDALFEIAFFYHKTNDYASATETYAKLAELYPFGLSYSNGEEFLEVSRMQRQTMRAEMVSKLQLLGYRGETLNDAMAIFQKANGLKVDGRASRETVSLIKQLYELKLKQEDQVSETMMLVRRALRWGFGVAAIAIINLLLVMAARSRVKQRRKQLASLEHMLDDLDVKGL